MWRKILRRLSLSNWRNKKSITGNPEDQEPQPGRFVVANPQTGATYIVYPGRINWVREDCHSSSSRPVNHAYIFILPVTEDPTGALSSSSGPGNRSKHFTVKIIDQNHPSFGAFDVEVENNLRVAQHPNILGLDSRFIHGERHFAVIPYGDVVSISHLIRKYEAFKWGMPEDVIAMVLSGVLMGLAEIHRNGFVHRELTSGTVYYWKSSPKAIKIAFAASAYHLSPIIDETKKAPSSTRILLPAGLRFESAAAPEVYAGEKGSVFSSSRYTAKSDIWLVGILALELAYGVLDVTNRSELKTIVRHVKGKPENRLRNIAQVFGGRVVRRAVPDMSEQFRNMVARCLSKKPRKRPTCEELLQNPFFADARDVNRFDRYLEKRPKNSCRLC